jgi:hypothetical protein
MLTQDAPSTRIRDVKLLFLLVIIFAAFRLIWPECLEDFWTKRTYAQKMVLYRLHQVSIAVLFLAGWLCIFHAEQLFQPDHIEKLRNLLLDLWETSFIFLLFLANLTGLHDNAYVPQRPAAEEQDVHAASQTQL